MAQKTRKRESRTEIDIKRAFLEILAHKPLTEMTVSEVAREAHVSRSTFYLHFGDLSALFDAIVRDMAVSNVEEETDLSNKEHACRASGKPLCAFARESRAHRAIIHEDRFISSLLQNRELVETSLLVRSLVESGYSFATANALLVFQISGCFAASVQTRLTDADWNQLRKTIDLFVEGGLEKLIKNAPGSGNSRGRTWHKESEQKSN